MEKKIYKFIIVILIFFSFVSFSEAATLSISPASNNLQVGHNFNVKVIVNSSNPINAVSASITFPANLVEIQSVSKAGSILDFWISEPNFSKNGVLNFEAVTLGGFGGGTGTVLNVTLKAIGVGTGKIIFNSGQILANDGQGTDVTGLLNPGSVSIEAKKMEEPDLEVKSKTEKDIEPEKIFQPLPTLNAPEIYLAKRFGERVIEGKSAYPDSQALVTFMDENGTKVFITIKTESQGEFILNLPTALRQGTYKVNAVVIRPDKTSTFPSNEITLKIGGIFDGLSRYLLVLIIILILLIAYLIFRISQQIKKNKNLRFLVKKEAREAENIVHKSFYILKKEVKESDREDLKKDLGDAEDLIVKEIEDIEKT